MLIDLLVSSVDLLVSIAFLFILAGIVIEKKSIANGLILLSLLLLTIAGILIGEVKVAAFPLLFLVFMLKNYILEMTTKAIYKITWRIRRRKQTREAESDENFSRSIE